MVTMTKVRSRFGNECWKMKNPPLLPSCTLLRRCLLVAASVFFLLEGPTQSHAQTLTENAQGIADSWQGTLHSGQDVHVVLKITKADDGYKAIFYSIDQGLELPARIVFDGATVKMTLTMNRAG